MRTTRRDLVEPKHHSRWLSHPVIGDPSYDSFRREAGNPIYVGKEPLAWPVNGFLFRDPPTGRWFAYVSLYPRGYFPCDGTLLLQERREGEWESAGVVLQGDARTFDGDGQRAGGTLDVSLVYHAGRYHLLYGWANPENTRGGLAYAWSERPTGPFHRDHTPIHEDTHQPPLLGRYVRAYASTLLRRRNDWLILHMMSTPRNAGGTWALAGMTSSNPNGPYSPPKLLLYPQSERFHPPLAEFYPAFVHGRYVYAPATSVALNRTFQVLFRAPLEQAHQPEAWEVHQYGSLWHAEPVPWEAYGIWGQTFAGQVSPDGTLRVLFPSKTADDVGTVNVAQRKFSQPFQRGFVLSAPRGEARAILREAYSTFTLHLRAQASGEWAVCWQCVNPLGANHHLADSTLHPLMHTSRLEWRVRENGWTLVRFDEAGRMTQIAQGRERADALQVKQDTRDVTLTMGGGVVWRGSISARAGRIELCAKAPCMLKVSQMELGGVSARAGEFWLATEALAGSAAEPGDWERVESPLFRYATGFLSAKGGVRAKWNFIGRGFRLYAPRSPDYGTCEVIVDGVWRSTLDLRRAEAQASTAVLEQQLPPGYHAVTLVAGSRRVPCDCLEVLP